MKADLSVIKLDNIEVPISFFETNLRVKTRLDELFERNNSALEMAICEMRAAAKNTYSSKYGKLDYNFLLSRFKFYFCKSVVYKAIINSFTPSGSRYSFEKNVVKYLTDDNLKEAIYGKEMHNTFQYIDFNE